ncbi:signal peptidase II [Amphibacillus sp. Q70]|uniref:signal peptidase II n=1 Tax=Amphibacillus sp. Q70 TaxID=3453416 RepID=UPI003F86AB6E
MKKPFIFSLLLILIDQMVKIWITRYYLGIKIVWIPNIIRFRPVQNTNLTWMASLLDYQMSIFSMLIIQVFFLFLTLIIYRYLSYLWLERQRPLKIMLACYIAGISCSFIDVAFWGGSWDFIRLFDWFTFDLKDIYLNVGAISVLFYVIPYHFKVYRKMNRTERKDTGVILWIKRGLPSSPIK